MVVDENLSTIMASFREASVSDFVYSALSFYALQRSGSLTGSWFVRALEPLGLQAAAVRQTLYRMERSGALLSSRQGRVKHYSPSPTTEAIIEAGLDRIRREPQDWDGRWTLIHFSFGTEDRKARDLARDVLQAEGFAALGPGVYLHPRDRAQRVLKALRVMGLEKNATSFRARLTHQEHKALVARLWTTSDTADRYQAFLARYRPIADSSSDRWTDLESFAIRFALVFEFLRISWVDPELPSELLDSPLQSHEARQLTHQLYTRLTEPALRYGDSVARDLEARKNKSTLSA